MNTFKKAILAAAMGATAIAGSAGPAVARPHYRHGHGDATGAAIGAGILGLAIGALVASSNNNHRDDYDRTYDSRLSAPPVYEDGFYFRDGYYWDRAGRRYDRDSYERYRRGYDYRSGYGRDDGYYRRGY